jgi:hypothetical protein
MILSLLLTISVLAKTPCSDAQCEEGATMEANFCQKKKGQKKDEEPELVRMIIECKKNEACEGTNWVKTDKFVDCE